jgi:hypothetical protein
MRSMDRVLRLLRREDGGALAELAILVPFLALMLAGVSEFGRYFENYNTLAKATRSSARYLSNHKLDDATEIARAQSLVVCGKLSCGVGDTPLLPNLSASNVCIESTGSPKVLNVTVKIPRTGSDCNPMAGTTAGAPYTYAPIFNIGALLNNPTFSLALPIAPSVTMYYMID